VGNVGEAGKSLISVVIEENGKEAKRHVRTYFETKEPKNNGLVLFKATLRVF